MTKILIPYRTDERQQTKLEIFLEDMCNLFPGRLTISKALIVESDGDAIVDFVSLLAEQDRKADPVPTSETPAPAAKPKMGRPRKVREPKTPPTPANTNSNGHQPDDQAPERSEAHQMALAAQAKLRGRKLG